MRTSEKQVSSPEPSVVRIGQVHIKGPGSLSSWVWKARSIVLTTEALIIANSRIPFKYITKVERVDLKPYCLLLEADNRRYHLSFQSDKEVNDWKDDVYVRCPLIGASNPFGFVHNVHVGFDAVSGAFNGLPTQWNETLAAPHCNEKQETPPIHHSLPASQACPTGPKSPSILNGQYSIKVDGVFTGWMWKGRWLVLGPRTLTIYKSKRSSVGVAIKLRDITSVERADARTHCLLIETRDNKRYFFSFKSDDQLYSWRDGIYSRSPLAGISSPTNFVHNVHIGFDPVTGQFSGMPDQWKTLMDMTTPRHHELAS